MRKTDVLIILGILLISFMGFVKAQNYNLILNETTGDNDTYISGGLSSQSFNYGASSPIVLTGGATSTQKRVLIYFDISSISTLTIKSVTLNLYGETVATGGNINVYLSNSSWTEGTGTGSATGDGATWTTRNGSLLWTTAGGDNLTLITSNSGSTVGGFNQFNVTQAITLWNSGTPNNGLILLTTNNSAFSWSFTSKNSGLVARRPFLNVTYWNQTNSSVTLSDSATFFISQIKVKPYSKSVSVSATITGIVASNPLRLRLPSATITLSNSVTRLTKLFKSSSVSATISALVTRIRNVPRIVSLTFSISNSITRLTNLFRSIIASLSLTLDIHNSGANDVRSLSQSFTLSNSVTRLTKLFKSSSVSATISALVTRIRNVPRSTSVGITLSNSIIRIAYLFRNMVQTAILTLDIHNSGASDVRSLSQSFIISNTISRLANIFRINTLSLTISNLVTRIRNVPRTMSVSLTFSNTISRLTLLFRTIIQLLALTLDIHNSGATDTRNQIINLNINPTTSRKGLFFRNTSVTETFTIILSRLRSVPRALSDALNLNALTVRLESIFRIQSNSLTFIEFLSGYKKSLFMKLGDALNIANSVNRIGYLFRTSTQGLTFSDSITRLGLILRTNTLSLTISNSVTRLTYSIRQFTDSFLIIGDLVGLHSNKDRPISTIIGITATQTPTAYLFRTNSQGLSFTFQIFKLREVARTLSDLITTNVLVARLESLFRFSSGSLIFVEFLSGYPKHIFIRLNELFNISNLISRTTNIFKAIFDNISVSITTMARLTIVRISNISLAFSDSLTRLTNLFRGNSVNLNFVATPLNINKFMAQLSDTININNFQSRLAHFFTIRGVSLTFSEFLVRMRQINVSLSQLIQFILNNFSGITTAGNPVTGGGGGGAGITTNQTTAQQLAQKQKMTIASYIMSGLGFLFILMLMVALLVVVMRRRKRES